jgi:hypothetical protein
MLQPAVRYFVLGLDPETAVGSICPGLFYEATSLLLEEDVG